MRSVQTSNIGQGWSLNQKRPGRRARDSRVRCIAVNGQSQLSVLGEEQRSSSEAPQQMLRAPLHPCRSACPGVSNVRVSKPPRTYHAPARRHSRFNDTAADIAPAAAIDAAHRGLLSGNSLEMFEFRGMLVVSILSQPYTLSLIHI